MRSADRYSIPFFHNPNAGTAISPLPSVVDDQDPAHYRPIDWSDFRYRRTDGDYADYGTEVQIAQYRVRQ
jgi:isopenicillin N synthase-like dioxygenase